MANVYILLDYIKKNKIYIRNSLIFDYFYGLKEF